MENQEEMPPLSSVELNDEVRADSPIFYQERILFSIIGGSPVIPDLGMFMPLWERISS